MCMHVSACLDVCHVHAGGWTREGIGCPGAAGVTGGCELPNMGTGNWIWVLWKVSKCSYSLRHDSSPPSSWTSLYRAPVPFTASAIRTKPLPYVLMDVSEDFNRSQERPKQPDHRNSCTWSQGKEATCIITLAPGFTREGPFFQL